LQEEQVKIGAAIADSICSFRRLLAIGLITAGCATSASAQIAHNGYDYHEWGSQERAIALLEEKWLNAINTATFSLSTVLIFLPTARKTAYRRPNSNNLWVDSFR